MKISKSLFEIIRNALDTDDIDVNIHLGDRFGYKNKNGIESFYSYDVTERVLIESNNFAWSLHTKPLGVTFSSCKEDILFKFTVEKDKDGEQ